MNWAKALLAGVVGGIVVNIYEFGMHGFVMADTYMKYPVFDKEQANPAWFVTLSVIMGIFAAIIFAKTRSSWSPGPKGGLVFGFWVGLIAFFAQFYYPLVIAGFPYHLAWCWGGITLIGYLLFGLVVGAMYKGSSA